MNGDCAAGSCGRRGSIRPAYQMEAGRVLIRYVRLTCSGSLDGFRDCSADEYLRHCFAVLGGGVNVVVKHSRQLGAATSGGSGDDVGGWLFSD